MEQEPELARGRIPTLWLGSAILLAVCLLVYVGLTPFGFDAPNGLEWTENPPGLAFDGRGLAFSEGRLRWPDGVAPALTVHLRLQATALSESGLGSILSLDDGQEAPRFVLAQWGDGLVLRVRALGIPGSGREHWEIGTDAALPIAEPRLITLTTGEATGTTLYVDGVPRSRSPKKIFGMPPDDAVELILGASRTGQAGWQGLIQEVVVYGRVLDAEDVARTAEGSHGVSASDLRVDAWLIYDLAAFARASISGDAVPNQAATSGFGPLRCPPTFDPPGRIVLEFPERESLGKPWFVRDAVRNFIGFMPLGWLLMFVLSRGHGRRNGNRSSLSGLALVVLAGAALSLSIELIQILEPLRVSSLVDLILNTAGTAAGALGSMLVGRFRTGLVSSP